MVPKHWIRFLTGGVGRIVQVKADDMERLYGQKEELERQLSILEMKIKHAEQDVEEFILEEWIMDEIQEAKEKSKTA